MNECSFFYPKKFELLCFIMQLVCFIYNALFVYFDSCAAVLELKVTSRRLQPPCRYYMGCFLVIPEPLANVSVPGGGCMYGKPGNQTMRF